MWGFCLWVWVFFLLVFHLTLKRQPEEGEGILYPGEPAEYCQVKKAPSQQAGKGRLGERHRQRILQRYHNSEKG